jgi:hypothetical protein
MTSRIEAPTFQQIAEGMIRRDISQTPLPSVAKAAILRNWHKPATITADIMLITLNVTTHRFKLGDF